MITLVANPSSRSGRGKRLWPLWRRALQKARIPHVFQESASAADCMDLAERASGSGLQERSSKACLQPCTASCERGVQGHHAPGGESKGAEPLWPPEASLSRARRFGAVPGPLVVAVGGDGTINAVINGLLRAPDENRAALGVLYSGTSPDFCRFHSLPLDARGALKALIAGEARPVDIAALDCVPAEGLQVRRHFASSCNIGLGAATACFANRWRRYFGDVPGTGLGLVRAMIGHRPFSCRLLLDGESADFEKVNHVLVLKNPHIASGIRIKLPARPDDGHFYAIVIHGYSRFGLLGLFRVLYSGEWSGLPGVFIRRCRTVELTCAPIQTVECDGDACGLTPVRARILPKALRLVGPLAGPCQDQAAPGQVQAAPRKDQAAPRKDQAAPRKDQAAPGQAIDRLIGEENE